MVGKKTSRNAMNSRRNSPLLHHVLGSQIGRHPKSQLTAAVRQGLTNKLPCLLQEKEFPCKDWKKYDKAFACEWVNEQHVIVGTKCNKLLCLNVKTSKVVEIPMPPRPARPAELSAAVHSGSCGIHSIAFNPDSNLLATGGDCPSDCQVFRVHSCADASNAAPLLQPVQTLVGHADWVFGCAWITERHLVTGSRDNTVKLWDVRDTGYQRSQSNMEPVLSSSEHKNKVRDIKYCRERKQLTSLGSDGIVKLWDCAVNPTRTVKLQFDKELVCLALQDGLVAIGSQSHVTLLDPRIRRGEVAIIESLDQNQGVRSISFLEHLLSCGSGQGRISFYDLRASKYIPLELDPDMSQATCTGSLAVAASRGAEPAVQQAQQQRQYLQSGPGWLCQNEVYLEHFIDAPVYNACYAHAWDQSKTKLMCVGGPLAFGLKGCYMALWD